ncbi:Xaa-Pro peptidase family protein [Simiduia sp. 21SJ11W-1]|uniref:M24 family metallopeptidase n=1 Tax=Simiduia sp. 21SJ11W-1 TaxID=2909669 RepID=UPI00209F6C19|nr:Xaa-Pro peptidase family protein [Simiduia sp. 21SJ11W-1]UTA46676.1 Xaa-Pro peptidase family protein [Simiduia sp. 21SJ11W-1]
MAKSQGVGGQSAEQALAGLTNMCADIAPLPLAEYEARLVEARRLMASKGIDAIYLNAGTNLYYFTGMRWYASERMVGALLTAAGELHFIGPAFEENTLRQYMLVEGEFHGWQEHESPYALFAQLLADCGLAQGTIGLDEAAQFFITHGIQQAAPKAHYVNADVISGGCRMHKSDAEIALIQRAMDMTMAVHKATAAMLRPGISTVEVEQFINRAHKAVGAGGSSFCIVLFGVATSFPHGVKDPQILQANDWVLIDTGCRLEGYNSDITRSYAFGEISARQRHAFEAERLAQLAAFDAAQLGKPCSAPDAAARKVLAEQGFSGDYTLPGLPHRTGHGCGLDIHEWPYLVKGNDMPLASGMVFSNEPMLVLPNEFGVRLEDHFYMTDNGPRWFTEPSASIDAPFGA